MTKSLLSEIGIGIIVTCFMVIGCATAKFTQTGNIYTPYDGPVKVYFAPPTDLKYEEIGLVSSSGGEIQEWTHLIEAITTVRLLTE